MRYGLPLESPRKMRFLIYIPGDGMANEHKLIDAGLPLLARGCAGIATSAGPDGKAGVVFSWPTADPRTTMGYLPDIQEWIPAVPSGDLPAKRYWVGLVKDALPGPGDLAVAQQFEGDLVTLGDGQTWKMPAAAQLPKKCRLADNGSWMFFVQDEFVAYWDESCQWYADLATRTIAEVAAFAIEVDASCCEYLARALSLNYRLTPEVISHLELFDSLNIGRAIQATIHGITLREEITQKKTDETALGI